MLKPLIDVKVILAVSVAQEATDLLSHDLVKVLSLGLKKQIGISCTNGLAI